MASLFSRVASRTSQRWVSSNVTASLLLLKPRTIPAGQRFCTTIVPNEHNHADLIEQRFRAGEDHPVLRDPSAKEIDEMEGGKINWDEMLWTYKELELPWNVDIASDMVVAFSKARQLDKCQEVFVLALDKSVDSPNTYLINCMMTAFNRCNEPQQCLDFADLHLDALEGLGLRANKNTSIAMLVACSKLGNATRAMDVFHTVQQSNYELERISFRALIIALRDDKSGYSQVGSALNEITAAMAKSKLRMDDEFAALIASARSK